MVRFWPEVQLWKCQRRLESFPKTRHLIWNRCEKESFWSDLEYGKFKVQKGKTPKGTWGPHPRAEAPPPSRSASSQLPQLLPACISCWIFRFLCSRPNKNDVMQCSGGDELKRDNNWSNFSVSSDLLPSTPRCIWVHLSHKFFPLGQSNSCTSATQ